MSDRNILIIATNYARDISLRLTENGTASYCFAVCPYGSFTPPQSVISSIYKPAKHVEALTMADVETYTIYDKICDLNSLPALSKQLLEAMLPYESMIIKMGRRREQYPSVEYEEEKRAYHKGLRFWEYIFKSRNITHVYTDTCPHYPYTYIIYSLAKIHGIPVMLHDVTSIPGAGIAMSSVENAGHDIREFYETLSDSQDYELEGWTADYWNKYSRPFTELIHDAKHSGSIRQVQTSAYRYYFANHLGLRGFAKHVLYPLRLLASSVLKRKSLKYFTDRLSYVAWKWKTDKRISYFIRHDAMSMKQYNKIAENPDYSKKYIYFALQLNPEETIMPRAGVFAEQETSIQLIARAAQKHGVYVYVKEHYVQAYREREVYDMIRSIPNVKLIKTSVTSFELMEHCIAVSTQTGTCILEGVLHGKPALVTSSGYAWKGLPGVFEVTDEEQGSNIISQILTSWKPDLRAVKRYFYAIQENSFFFYDPHVDPQTNMEKYTPSLEGRIKSLEKFLS